VKYVETNQHVVSTLHHQAFCKKKWKSWGGPRPPLAPVVAPPLTPLVTLVPEIDHAVTVLQFLFIQGLK
jgi:hypothetical protein